MRLYWNVVVVFKRVIWLVITLISITISIVTIILYVEMLEFTISY